MKNIKVVICGTGAVAREAAEILIGKKGIEIVGVAGRKSYIGEDFGDVIGLNRKMGIAVSNDLDAILDQTKPDVLLDATSSLTRQVFPTLIKALDAGVNVVTACEELTNPWIAEPELARELDDAAKKNGASLVTSGLNPGWYLDQIPYAFTGACATVKKIRGFRVVDGANPADTSMTVSRNFGIGLEIEEAKKQIAEGKITGHVGLKETIHLLADAIGWKLTKVDEKREPLPCPIDRNYKIVKIKKGQSYGIRYNGYGMVDDEEVIRFDGIWACSPTMEIDGFEPGYTLWIEGKPNLKVTIDGATGVGHNTITPARLCNWVPHIVKAKPGVLTDMTEFPLIGVLQDQQK